MPGEDEEISSVVSSSPFSFMTFELEFLSEAMPAPPADVVSLDLLLPWNKGTAPPIETLLLFLAGLSSRLSERDCLLEFALVSPLSLSPASFRPDAGPGLNIGSLVDVLTLAGRDIKDDLLAIVSCSAPSLCMKNGIEEGRRIEQKVINYKIKSTK